MIQFMLLVDEPQYFSSVWVVGVGLWSSELFHKLCGDLAAV